MSAFGRAAGAGPFAFDRASGRSGGHPLLQFVVVAIDRGNATREPLIANSSVLGIAKVRSLTIGQGRIEEADVVAYGHRGWNRVPVAIKHTNANQWKRMHFRISRSKWRIP